MSSNIVRRVCALIAAVLVPAGIVQAQAIVVLRVDANAPTSTGDGLTWGTAFDTLQKALDAAPAIITAGNTPEVWVADGTYKPEKRTFATDPRSATFAMPSTIQIFAGFEGFGGAEETLRSQRDAAVNITILSGTSA